MPECRRCGVALEHHENSLCAACWDATEDDCDEMMASDDIPPTPEEMADLLRLVQFAMSHGRSAMVAFFDTKYGASAIERDYERMKEVERQVKAMLDRLPPEPPMSPEHMAKVGAVVGAALRKRFGEGSQAELVEAIEDAWPDSTDPDAGSSQRTADGH